MGEKIIYLDSYEGKAYDVKIRHILRDEDMSHRIIGVIFKYD